MEAIAKREHLNLIGVDIGGATTDVFSVFNGAFNRTVSANLGMSYSVSNVLVEAGLVNIMRWVPFTIDEQTLRNRIKNKMIRPTTIPQTLDELQIEQAIAREALRLALIHHKSLATGLKGVQQERTISDVFEQQTSGKTLIDMLKLDLIVGSGGILSHAPRRIQSMLMMVDAYGLYAIVCRQHLHDAASGCAVHHQREGCHGCVRARLHDLSRDLRGADRTGEGRRSLCRL
jgi:hypothetical protein